MKQSAVIAAVGWAVLAALLAGCGQQPAVSAGPAGPNDSNSPDCRDVLFEMRFIACPVKAADELAIDWRRTENPDETVSPWRQPAKDRLPEPVAEPTTAPAGGAAERVLCQPVVLRWALLEEKGKTRLIEHAQGFRAGRMLTCPRITPDSGQQSQTTVSRGPYIRRTGGPSELGQIESDFECIGHSPIAFVCGRIVDGNQVAVSCRFHVSEYFLRSKLLPGTPEPDPNSPQAWENPFYRPPPTYYRISAFKTLASGQTLALRVYPAEEKDMPDLALIILVRPVIGPKREPNSARQPEWVPEPREPL